MSDNPLKQAQDLYKNGRQAEAQKMVVAYVYDNRDDPKGWWALANIAPEAEVKIKSLKNVLRLKPDFEQARAMLDQLEPPNLGGTITQPKGKKPLPRPQSQTPPPTTLGASFYIPVLLGVAVCVFCVCCAALPYALAGSFETFGDQLLESETLGFGQYMTPVAPNPSITKATLGSDLFGEIPRTLFSTNSFAYLYVEFRDTLPDLEVRWYRLGAGGARELISSEKQSTSDFVFFAFSTPQVGRYEAELYYQGRLERRFVFRVE